MTRRVLLTKQTIPVINRNCFLVRLLPNLFDVSHLLLNCDGVILSSFANWTFNHTIDTLWLNPSIDCDKAFVYSIDAVYASFSTALLRDANDPVVDITLSTSASIDLAQKFEQRNKVLHFRAISTFSICSCTDFVIESHPVNLPCLYAYIMRILNQDNRSNHCQFPTKTRTIMSCHLTVTVILSSR